MTIDVGPSPEDVSRIIESLGPLPSPQARPALVVLCGLPGTGKSHVAGALQRRTDLAVLESDVIRKLLFPRPRYSAAESRRLFAALHAAIDRLLAARVPCLLDATNLLESYREPLYEIARRRKARLVLIEVTVLRPVARERLSDRSRYGPSSDADVIVYERMRRQFEPPTRPHFTLDTSEDLESKLDEIARDIQTRRAKRG